MKGKPAALLIGKKSDTIWQLSAKIRIQTRLGLSGYKLIYQVAHKKSVNKMCQAERVTFIYLEL